MSTDLNLLRKGIIRLGVLVLLLIGSPIIITMGFKAVNKFTESPKSYIAYAIVFLGCILIIFTISFAFKVFKIFKQAIFNNN